MSGTWQRHFWPLYRKARALCHYCGGKVSRDVDESHPDRATLDHRIPRSRGGSNARANIVLACRGCNERKGNMTDQEFLGLFLDKNNP